ncbi:MAG: hypothetical protein Q8S58_16165 [Bosea sp. (in: a-proteobacteria)]|uniref:hypothetical protein n=1 Tax=Bosea sp. (in: a-proteobacteria) TaxID=1871050 RepID=UPI00273436A1|nr:hypothetical protein [Bosea sp. (in: a-proteobacteria)]MDP3255887.1 hypothetical protein [Bosea sp. (in: a-proteobacteria)]MDP3320660.1 hypothetical protein [Bosea sp. (in: a-proteobacteria)]
MAYILRSLAVIGVIALHSPVHGERSQEHDAAATARKVAAGVPRVDVSGTMSSLTAAREAAQIFAGLDPETRQRLIEMAAAAATGRDTQATRTTR